MAALTRAPDPRRAVELLRDVLGEAARTGELVTLVATAPLTNVALLLRTHPEAASGLREIVFMGGAVNVGNATASAEFNVFHDPEAAAIVLETAAELGVDVTMYGLDVFYQVTVTRTDGAKLVASGGQGPAELAGRLVEFVCDRFRADRVHLGDAGAVCVVIDRSALTTQSLPVRVELSGTYSRGRTIVDRRDWSGNLDHDPHGIAPSRVEVALGVDGERYARLWIDTVGATAPDPLAARPRTPRGDLERCGGRPQSLTDRGRADDSRHGHHEGPAGDHVGGAV